jgi:hypothetical protein
LSKHDTRRLGENCTGRSNPYIITLAIACLKPWFLKLWNCLRLQSHGISIFEYDSNGIGAKAYRELMALKRSKIGNNRLAQGIFSKTEPEEESLIKNQEPLIKNHHSWLMVLDSWLNKVNKSTFRRLLRKYGFKHCSK